jgi:hypothetical protein
MVQIDNTIVSFDIFERYFCCNINACLGACCVEGESGAPLEDDEIASISANYKQIEPFLTKKGRLLIEKYGFFVVDIDGDKVTPIIDGKECAFCYFDGEVCKCGIEKAWNNKLISFQKPVSCHLYPIRITKYTNYDAINFHVWKVCKPAVALGKSSQLPVYQFLKAPLIRKYGQEWFEKLVIAARELEEANFINKK